MAAENGAAKAPGKHARIGEIRAELNALVPYEPAGQVTARGLALYLAMEAQTYWAREAAPAGDLDVRDVAALNASMAASWALLALHAVAPSRAGEVAGQIRAAWEDLTAAGDWLAANLGPHAGRIAELAAELATLEGPGGQDAEDAGVLRDALGRVVGIAVMALGKAGRPEPDLDALADAIVARGLLDGGRGECGGEGAR